MGMESYFIKLNVQNLKSSVDIKQAFAREYNVSKYRRPSGKLFRRHIVDDSRFVIDNKAVVTVAMLQDAADITFELCFSNYECNLSYIYNVAKWVSLLGETTQLKVLNSEYNFNNLEFEKFNAIISESYFNKFHQFRKHYGKIDKDILPHDFYNWVRRTGINRKI